MADLRDGRPRIGVWPAGEDGIYVNPQTMLEGEDALLCERLDEILFSEGRGMTGPGSDEAAAAPVIELPVDGAPARARRWR